MASITFNSNSLTSPAWAGDDLGGENLVPGGAKLLASAFNLSTAFVVTVSSNAAQGATSIAVSALGGAIPAGTLLDFGSGAGLFALLTADAAAGATSLTVEALPEAIASGKTATYQGTGKKSIASGTLLGRTYTERDANTPFGPAADGDDEFYLLAFDVTDADQNNDCELYRHGRIVWENYLPVFSTLSSTQKSKIRTLYESSIAVN